MSDRERPPETPSSPPVSPTEPPPPYEPQLDLIGDMEIGPEWIVDHRRGEVRRAPDSA